MASLPLLLCLLGAALPLILYPAAVALIARLRPRPWTDRPAPVPFVSVITVMHDGAAFVAACAERFCALDYPADRKELILFEDGDSPEFARETAAIITCRSEPGAPPDIVAAASGARRGKAHGIGKAVLLARGDILIFCDADSAPFPDALAELVQPFADPAVGGVCGRRVVGATSRKLHQAQTAYFDFDRTIKEAESRLGSLTSNDGKLYAVRRSAFRGIPDGVTDDLYVCLDVVRQGLRFVYAPKARAETHTPSRDTLHELERRRRIVSTSLRGLWLCRELFDPRRFGWYAPALFINKALRRGLPFFLAGIFALSIALAPTSRLFALFFLGQLGLLLLALSHLSTSLARRSRKLARLAEIAWYFLVGNLGTALGVLDFARGKVVVTWTPKKGKEEGP